MSKTGYEFNGQVATTIRELSDLVGHKVTKAQVLANEVEGVTVIELDEEVTQEEVVQEIQDAVESGDLTQDEAQEIIEDSVAEEVTEEEIAEAEALNDEVVEDTTEEEDSNEDSNDHDQEPPKPTMAELKDKLKAIREAKATNTPTETSKPKKHVKGEDVEYPEKGTFKTEKELKKFYKNLTDQQLDEWLELEGLTKEVKLTNHEAINRMRKCMSIMDYHFPKANTGASKKKSKYADFSTEELVGMAIENDVEVKDDKGDAKILRMYTIMALKNAGLLK